MKKSYKIQVKNSSVLRKESGEKAIKSLSNGKAMIIYSIRGLI